jgi:hypothetical protein
MSVQQNIIKAIIQRAGGQPAAFNNNNITANMAAPLQTYQPNYGFQQALPDVDDVPDYDSDLSPIVINISSPVTITGHGNLVAFDPSTTAAAIAEAVARSLKSASVSSSGIPMIDEEGRPRPIKVTVDTPVKVQGDKNMIGDHPVMLKLREGVAAMKQRREAARSIPTPTTASSVGGSFQTDNTAEEDDSAANKDVKDGSTQENMTNSPKKRKLSL